MSKLPFFPMVIGLVGGAIWGFTRQFLEKKGVITMQLHPKPEAFDIDPYLTELYTELATYSDLDQQAFESSVALADRILLLEKQLRERKTFPVAGDTTRIFTFRRRLCVEFQILLTKCTDARRLSLMRRVIGDIIERINQHYNCISIFCERLKAEDVLDS